VAKGSNSISKIEETYACLKVFLSNTFQGERCAICAPSNLQYGMSRTHEMLTRRFGIKTMVFREFQEALAWLDIDLLEGESAFRSAFYSA
jgi:hypothetical protein